MPGTRSVAEVKVRGSVNRTNTGKDIISSQLTETESKVDVVNKRTLEHEKKTTPQIGKQMMLNKMHAPNERI